MSKIEAINPKIEASWKAFLFEHFQQEQFIKLIEFINEDRKTFDVFPPDGTIYTAFNETSVEGVRCIILGQDPYHGPGQAHGLAFSVPDGIKKPPSLLNIFKELKADLNIEIPDNGSLLPWAKQGVLLLNATLTVRSGQAGSHQGKGWESFTDAVISKLSLEKENLVFLLWGKFAQAKEHLIDQNKHCILKAPHPSPFSAHTGFFGCRHFSKTNAYLNGRGKGEINWTL